LIGSFDRFTPALHAPSGEDFARLTVVEAQGCSDSAQIRIKKLR